MSEGDSDDDNNNNNEVGAAPKLLGDHSENCVTQ
jgi:hypothetical protein